MIFFRFIPSKVTIAVQLFYRLCITFFGKSSMPWKKRIINGRNSFWPHISFTVNSTVLSQFAICTWDLKFKVYCAHPTGLRTQILPSIGWKSTKTWENGKKPRILQLKPIQSGSELQIFGLVRRCNAHMTISYIYLSFNALNEFDSWMMVPFHLIQSVR